MAHTTETAGLVGLSLAGTIMEELDQMTPGFKSRVLARMRADLAAEHAKNPNGNAQAMLDLLAPL